MANERFEPRLATLIAALALLLWGFSFPQALAAQQEEVQGQQVLEQYSLLMNRCLSSSLPQELAAQQEKIQGQPRPLQRYPLLDSHVETLVGQADPNATGCRFAIRGHMAADQRVVEGRGIGPIQFEGDSCKVQVEVGEPDPREIEELKQWETTATQQGYQQKTRNLTRPEIQQTSEGKQGVRIPGHACATLRMWWTDPIGLTVNSARSTNNWDYDPDIPAVTAVLAQEELTWLSLSGWQLSWDYLSIVNPPPSLWSTSRVGAGFWNFIFCPLCCFGDPTYAEYNPVDVTGLFYGGYDYFGYSYVSGGCISALSPNWLAIRCG